MLGNPGDSQRSRMDGVKASIGPDTAAYAALMAVEPGDIMGLLRTMRSNFERKSTPFRHQLLAELARTNLVDFPGIRQYVSSHTWRSCTALA